jgi:hypothetical protein
MWNLLLVEVYFVELVVLIFIDSDAVFGTLAMKSWEKNIPVKTVMF